MYCKTVLVYCSLEEIHSYRSWKMWGWVNDDRTIPEVYFISVYIYENLFVRFENTWSLKVCIFIFLAPWRHDDLVFEYRSCIWLTHVSLSSSWLTKDCWSPVGKAVTPQLLYGAKITLTRRVPPVPFLTDFSAEVSKGTTGSAGIHAAVEKLKNQLWYAHTCFESWLYKLHWYSSLLDTWRKRVWVTGELINS